MPENLVRIFFSDYFVANIRKIYARCMDDVMVRGPLVLLCGFFCAYTHLLRQMAPYSPDWSVCVDRHQAHLNLINSSAACTKGGFCQSFSARVLASNGFFLVKPREAFTDPVCFSGRDSPRDAVGLTHWLPEFPDSPPPSDYKLARAYLSALRRNPLFPSWTPAVKHRTTWTPQETKTPNLSVNSPRPPTLEPQRADRSVNPFPPWTRPELPLPSLAVLQ
ncbi:uncharacterized protein LOC116711471 [Xiphophorus hellerii]|uniref:uncharacterized protein LOC116711471 n=1 Tax=Xiphophorus hellerii TaxID=8084 RepID=UPI0013B3AF82|nr:uncharacterized protein LOC116711471 [Xiphophorus hellerii]